MNTALTLCYHTVGTYNGVYKKVSAEAGFGPAQQSPVRVACCMLTSLYHSTSLFRCRVTEKAISRTEAMRITTEHPVTL